MSREENVEIDGAAEKSPPLALAVFPIVVLIVLLGLNVWFYTDSATGGPNQIALLLAAAAAVGVGLLLGIHFKRMMDGIVKSLGSAISAMLILLMIGSLAGTWMLGGIVPAMIYYGLDILDPKYFLVASLAICAIVSVATGSSWSTVATVGIALMAIAKALDVSEAMTAGAIISGAYFGDKMSPLSDTTNLASAMAGTELFTHIRYMLWTTVPSILIAAGIFAVIGLTSEGSASTADTVALKEAIAAKFHISYWLLLVPLAVIVMVILKFDALIALFLGTMLGAVVAICVQPEAVKQVSGLDKEKSYASQSYVAFFNSLALETSIVPADEQDSINSEINQILEKENAAIELENSSKGEDEAKTPPLTVKGLLKMDVVDSELKSRYFAKELLNGKGMEGMLGTIWLIICAMCFGGVMEACGLLQRITQPLLRFAKSTGSLITTTAASCLFVNFTASDQYLAIVVPGRMFRDTFAKSGLAPQNLSRTLEDSGTVTSVLIPWNTCGASQMAVLGIGVAYIPFCFFNLVSPFMTILIGFLGIGIAKLATDGVGKDSGVSTDVDQDE